ncbi:MAG TPA: BlaI/MecI/CopY family transcriptional regulator, partial [Pirellulaceae bacterium]
MTRPPLSRLELEVARVLCDLGEGTLGAIHEALVATRPMEYTTLQTYVRRLEAKGYIKAERFGRTKLYRPKVRAKQIIRETVNDVLRLLFDGQAVPMMKHLMQDRPISTQEIQELKQLVQELEDGA